MTKGLVATIDAVDLPLIAGRNWSASQGGTGEHYAISAVLVDGTWTTQRMHRVILGLSKDDARDVDHQDMDTLNNRRTNLRICSRRLNLGNKHVRADSATGVKGVYLHPSGKYRAKIKGHDKSVHLGYFDTIDAAKAAYDAKALELFGEFAR